MPRTTADHEASATAGGGSDAESVTRLLATVEGGDEGAWDRIYALLYDDLRRIARSQIRQQAGARLSPTSLISETWLKLAGAKLSIANRRHLVALIARAMRFVLLDETRRMLAGKRQALADAAPLADDVAAPEGETRLEQLLALDQALDELARIDARLAQVVELRYFGGLTEEEAAGSLDLSVRTIRRDWRRARAFLLDRLGGPASDIAI